MPINQTVPINGYLGPLYKNFVPAVASFDVAMRFKDSAATRANP